MSRPQPRQQGRLEPRVRRPEARGAEDWLLDPAGKRLLLLIIPAP
jgi:hypothetical protein